MSTNIIHEAMSILGTQGVIEDFTCLPRLYRNSNIFELCEGPRNELLTKLYNDFKINADWFSIEEFVNESLTGSDKEEIEHYTQLINEIIAHPNLYNLDEKTICIAKRWDKLSDDFMMAFQELARQQVLKTLR